MIKTTQQQTPNKPLTPLEKLLADKEQIKQQCAIQEQRLNDNFVYIQENAGSLLMSGLSSILFPTPKIKKTAPDETVAVAQTTPTTPLGFSDYIGIAQGLLPVAWDVAKPILVTWGIKKAQTWFINLLFKKKK